MATITSVGALRMVATLAGGDIAIVTSDTLIAGFTVRKRDDHRCPRRGGMASIAQIAG